MLLDANQPAGPGFEERRLSFSTTQIVVFLAAVLGLVAARWLIAGVAPAATAEAYLLAIAEADLATLDGLSEKPASAAYAERLAEQEAKEVGKIREKVVEEGARAWQAMRERVEVACATALTRLRDKANEAGRAEYERLPVADRMTLITDRARYATFLTTAGLPALPDQERQLLQAAVSAGDHAVLVDSHGLTCSPEEARPGVSNQAVLSRKASAEKAAFLERVGRERLDGWEKFVLDAAAEPTPAGMTRGEFLAKERLLMLRLRPGSAECANPRLKLGALLPSRAPDWRKPEGGRAGCTATFVLAGQKVERHLALVRQWGRWKVKGENPFEWAGGGQ